MELLIALGILIAIPVAWIAGIIVVRAILPALFSAGIFIFGLMFIIACLTEKNVFFGVVGIPLTLLGGLCLYSVFMPE